MAAQPGRPGHGAAAGLAQHEGTWVGWTGAPTERRAGRRAVRDSKACACTRCRSRRRGRAVLRGLLQRQPLAALPRRGRAAGLRAALVGGVPARSTSASPTPRAEVAATGRHRLGAGLPAPARAGDAPRAAARPADRVLPAHPVPAGRAVHAAAAAGRGAARGCSAPTWSASSGRSARRTSSRLARHAARPAPARRTASNVRTAGSVAAGAFPISIDVAEMERARRSEPEVQARASEIRRSSANPTTIILGVDRLDYTKGIEQRLKAFRELLAEGRLTVPDDGDGPGRHAQPGTGRALPGAAGEGRARGRPDQRRVRRVGVPAVHYLHQSYARSELAALYLRRRRHDGDAAARRHEPGGQGVRRRPRRPRRRAGAVASSPARPPSCARRSSCNPHDLDGVKDALMRAINVDPAEAAGGCERMRRQLRTHDVRAWADPFLTALGRTGRPDMTSSADRAAPSSATRPRAAAYARRARPPTPRGRRRASPACRSCSSPATTTARWRRSSRIPTTAAPLPEAVAALRALAALPQTTVARDLRPRAARPGRPVPAAQRGPPGRQPRLRVRRRVRRRAAPEPAALRAELHATLRRDRPGQPGVRLEVKPASVAVHTRARRPATSPSGCSTRSAAARRPGPDIHVTTRQGGRRAVGGRRPTRGTPLDALRHAAVGAARSSSSATTSPTRTPSPSCTAPTSASRSAPGETRAPFRVADPPRPRAAARRCCCRPGGSWLFGERAVPIERHSMLANGRTVALVTPGRPRHLAVPPAAGLARRSSPTCSAAPPAGHFTVAPGARRPAARPALPAAAR